MMHRLFCVCLRADQVFFLSGRFDGDSRFFHVQSRMLVVLKPECYISDVKNRHRIIATFVKKRHRKIAAFAKKRGCIVRGQ